MKAQKHYTNRSSPATYINIFVTIALAKCAEIIVLAIAIAIDLQITKFRSGLGSWHGGGLGRHHCICWHSVIIELIYIRSSLSAAWAGTGISQAHLIARVLTVGLGGVGVAKMIDAW